MNLNCLPFVHFYFCDDDNVTFLWYFLSVINCYLYSSFIDSPYQLGLLTTEY